MTIIPLLIKICNPPHRRVPSTTAGKRRRGGIKKIPSSRQYKNVLRKGRDFLPGRMTGSRGTTFLCGRLAANALFSTNMEIPMITEGCRRWLENFPSASQRRVQSWERLTIPHHRLWPVFNEHWHFSTRYKFTQITKPQLIL